MQPPLAHGAESGSSPIQTRGSRARPGPAQKRMTHSVNSCGRPVSSSKGARRDIRIVDNKVRIVSHSHLARHNARRQTRGGGQHETSGRHTRDVHVAVGTERYCAAGWQTQHPLHHGRRHRLDAAEHLPSRSDGRRDTQHRPYRARGCEVHDLLRRAKLHRRAHRLFHRHDAAARRHDPAATAR